MFLWITIIISLHKPSTDAKFRLPQLHSKEFEKKTIPKKTAITLLLAVILFNDSTAENDRLFLFFLFTARKNFMKKRKIEACSKKFFDCVSEKFKHISFLLLLLKETEKIMKGICFQNRSELGTCSVLTNIIFKSIPHKLKTKCVRSIYSLNQSRSCKWKRWKWNYIRWSTLQFN